MCKFIDSARECFLSKKSEHNNRLINDSIQTQVTILSPCLVMQKNCKNNKQHALSIVSITQCMF